MAIGHSGAFVDFTKLAGLAGIERMSARRYFDVLVDTLVVYPVGPFSRAKSPRLIQPLRQGLMELGY